MLTKLESVHCPLCSKPTRTKIHEEEIEIDENKILYWEICDDCEALKKESVTLICLGTVGEIEKDGVKQKVPCCTVMMITKDVLEQRGFVEWVDFELGWKMELTGCQMCSEDRKIHFPEPTKKV